MKNVMLIGSCLLLIASCRRTPSPEPKPRSMLIVNADTILYDSTKVGNNHISTYMQLLGNPILTFEFTNARMPKSGNVHLTSLSEFGFCVMVMYLNDTIYGVPSGDKSFKVHCSTYGSEGRHYLHLDSTMVISLYDTGGTHLIRGDDTLWIRGDFYQSNDYEY